MPGHDIIVIGASAGGLEPIMRLIGAMPDDLPASIFVCLHIPPHSPSMLPTALWTAVRALDERRDLAAQLGERAIQRGYKRAAEQFKKQAAEAIDQAQAIRDLLSDTSRLIFETKSMEDQRLTDV